MEVLNIYLIFSIPFCSTVFLKVGTGGPGKIILANTEHGKLVLNIIMFLFQMAVTNIYWILVKIKSLDCLLKVQENVSRDKGSFN